MITASLPPLHSLGRALDTSDKRFGFLRESDAHTLDIATIRERFAEDGYVYLKQYLEPGMVLNARRAIFQQLAHDGLLDPDFDLMEGVLRDPKAEGLVGHHSKLIRQNPEIKRVVFGDELCEFYKGFFGEPIRYFDFIWARAKGRGRGTPPHCDWVYMGRGSKQLMTAWIPYGDVPIEMGGLIVLEKSHLQRERIASYLDTDVDAYCANDPEQAQAVGVEGKSVHRGYLSNRPDTLAGKFNSRWLTARKWQAGDVLTFRMDLIHAALDNTTSRLRFSTDTRYQPASHPADDRWIGVNPPGHSVAGKRGRIC